MSGKLLPDHFALARRCQLNSYKIETRYLNEEEAEHVAGALESYLANEGQYLELWEAGLTTTLADAAAWAVSAKAKHPDKAPFIVVDYLQLARTGIKEVDANLSETKRVSDVAVGCKDLARRTGAAVLALSSVTKEAERMARTEGELDVTAARDSLAIIHAADGVLTLQTQPMTLSLGKKGGEQETIEVDPWGYMAQDAKSRSMDKEAVELERAIEKLSKRFPQNGPNYGVRARLSLVRHRGRTGDVALYYHRAFHDMEEVALPGLEPIERDLEKSESAIPVFQRYVNQEAPQTPSKAPERPVEAHNESTATVASPDARMDTEFKYIRDLGEATAAIAQLTGLVGLDFETTGLSPVSHQPRLLSLYDGNGPALVIDIFAIGGLHLLREQLLPLHAVAHNASFDMGFLQQHGHVGTALECTLLAHHVITGDTKKLKELAAEYLGLDMDKAAQKSDWSADTLTEEQLRYAALDAIAVWEIFPHAVGSAGGNGKPGSL